MITYFGEIDNSVNMFTLINFLKLAWGKGEADKFFNQAWKIKNRPDYVKKTYRNLKLAVIRGSGHMVSWDKPRAVYHFVKKAVEEDL
jgi:carboxypeptidase C (cathepsin A)